MSESTVGILHPGEMGASIAAAISSTGRRVYWASEGRSGHTQARAEKAGLEDLGTIARLCRECDFIVSVCPPHAAEAVALAALAAGFRGSYLDANAISPGRARRIADAFTGAGVIFVDGSIIGPPAWTPGTTRIYLSGKAARKMATLFADSTAEAVVIGADAGRASALKMCFAAYSKGTTALLSAILAAADHLGVSEELRGQWSTNDAEFAEKANLRVREVTRKAWRFAGEMEEIAATFREAGLPGEFHSAAAEIYRRLAAFKGAEGVPSLLTVLAAARAEELHSDPDRPIRLVVSSEDDTL